MKKLIIITSILAGCATYDARNNFMGRCVGGDLGTFEQCRESWANAERVKWSEVPQTARRGRGPRESSPREAMFCRIRCTDQGHDYDYCHEDCATQGGWKHSGVEFIHYHTSPIVTSYGYVPGTSGTITVFY